MYTIYIYMVKYSRKVKTRKFSISHFSTLLITGMHKKIANKKIKVNPYVPNNSNVQIANTTKNK